MIVRFGLYLRFFTFFVFSHKNICLFHLFYFTLQTSCRFY